MTSAKPTADIKSMTQSVQARVPAASSHRYTALTDVPKLANTKPISIRLPDGSEVPVRRWKDVLREACKFTFLNATSVSVPLGDRAGRKVSLLSTTKPPSTIAYVEEIYGDQVVYIYTNYDADNCAKNAAYILSHVPKAKLKVTAGVAFLPNL